MSNTTYAIITRLSVTRNRIADLIMKVDQIDLMTDLSAISDEIENAIYNIKAMGA